MIVKHRRGTTQEWKDFDLIPEEGELIIEECLDGTRKCKIGTGYTIFSKLPYIDDKTKTILLQELAKTQAELEEKIAEIKESLPENISSIRQEISQVIEAKSSELTNDFINRDEIVSTDIKGEISKTANTLRSETKAATKAVTEQAQEARNNLKTELESKIAKDISEAKTSLESTIFDEKSAREGAINDIYKVIADADIASKNELNSAINKLDNTINTRINSVVSQTASDISSLETQLDNKAEELDNKIDDSFKTINEALTAAINTLEQQTKEADENNTAQIRGLEKDIAALATFNKGLVDRIDLDQEKLLANIEDLDTRITDTEEGLQTDLAAVETALIDKMSYIEQQGTAAAEELSKHINTLKESVNSLSEKLKATQGQLDTDVEKFLANIEDLDTRINTAEDSLSDELTEIETTLDGAITLLEQYCKETDAELLAQIKSVMENVTILHSDISTLEGTFLEYRDKTIASFCVLEETIGIQSTPAAGVEGEDDYVPAEAATGIYAIIEDGDKELTDQIASVNQALLDTKTTYEAKVAELTAEDAEIRQEILEAATGLTSAIEALEKRFIGEDGEMGDGKESVVGSLQKQIAALETDTNSKFADVQAETNNISTEMQNLMSYTSDNFNPEVEGSFANTLIKNISSTNDALQSEINTNKGYIKSLQGDITSAHNQAASAQTAVLDIQASVTDLSKDLQSLSEETAGEFTEINEIIANNKSIAEADIAEVNKTIETLDQHITDTNKSIEVQANRIDTLIALPDGSTTADAELIDIRNGYSGEIYTSAGAAVRAVGNDIKALRDSLSQYIDTQAIDGLHYDLTGEIDQQRPYTLYLTANKEVIPESGVQIISGAGGGGGGGGSVSSLKISYITTSPVITTVNDTTKLLFTFSGTDSSGDIVQEASATWKVNNVVVAYGIVKDGGNEFDITKHLSVGTNKVFLLVTDDNGNTVTKTWTVEQKELLISSAFNDKITYASGEEIVFTYTPEGAVDKTAKFKLDGIELPSSTLTADISGIPRQYRIPAQEHGSHLLEVYLEAEINGSTITSNCITKDILVYNADSKLPIIGTSVHNFNIKQYSTVNILYTVYDPKSEMPIVEIEVDGVNVSTVEIKANPEYNNTPTGVYSYTGVEAGRHTIKIICVNQIKTVYVDVEKLDITIAPVTAGLAFDFNPVGRNNNDSANRLWSYNDVHMTVSDNFDWINGGYRVEDGEPCFCIKAGSTATIDYKLFADDAKKYGKEFKLIFKTKNVANPDSIFLSCIDNTTDRDHIGIEMGVHNANIYGQNGSLELAYSEEDLIEFEFNISSDTEKVPMVMGYEDGVPSRPMVYDNNYNFKQNTAKDITIGSPDCDVYIYRFKVYNNSLTNIDILNNFIADARTAEEMVDRYNRNQIYDENHKLTPEVLAEKCPWLRVYKLSAPHFTNNKSDKVSNTKIQQIYKNGDPVKDNWVCYNAQHSGQGTSSNDYGAAGRNLDFIMNKSNSYFEFSDGSTARTITLTRTSVPVAYLNAKVNIASSNNLTNAMLANRYNKFNPYRRPFIAREGVNTDFIKDTMEFHNCVIFIQETDPDLSTHREFADTDWHFYAIGNIGDSKKTDNTRLTDPNDRYECCVEIMDVELPLSDFPVDTMIDAMGYKEDETTHERTYIWAKDENLDKLYELEGEFVKTEDTEVIRNKAYYTYNAATDTYKCVAYPSKNNLINLYELRGDYVLTTDIKVDLTKKYYIDILEHDDFSEDFTYGWRYISDDEDPDVVNTCKQAWIDFYRFVTTSTDEEFKANLKNYFVIDSALYYYLFTLRYCMVDNRAKNTFWHYGKAADGTHKWDLCWDYDNDTSLGLNNYGKQVYRYGLEDTDVDAVGEEVFREMDSTFFCKVRDCFRDELKTMYNTLESQNAWHAESFIKACDDWQNEFPEELWRLDIDRKYIRTYTGSFINGKGAAQFLVNMSNGKMKYHRRQWERSQEQYMASKYQTSTAGEDSSVLRCSVPTGDLAVQPNYRLKLTPYAYIYLNVKYGTNSPIQVRAVPNEEFEIPFTGTGADIIGIYSSSLIQDFGDLSTCYATTADTAKASRIRKLTLGNDTAGYINPGFTTLTTGANPLLEELNVENVTGLTRSLDLRELINLKRVYAFGTNIPGALFADGGKLEYVELPNVTTINLRNLSYLGNDGLVLESYDDVVDLVVENCPLINKIDLLDNCVNLKRLRLTDINFGDIEYDDFAEKFFGLGGLSSSGADLANAYISGTCHINSLTGEQYSNLNTRYPELDIGFGTLTSKVTFKYLNSDGSVGQELHTATVVSNNSILNSCPDPELTVPTWPENDAFKYVHVGWSSTKQISKGVNDHEEDYKEYLEEDALLNIAGDRVLYPVFKADRKSYTVWFTNPTASEGTSDYLLKTFTIPYGSNVNYYTPYNNLDEYLAAGMPVPSKLDSNDPSLYAFTGWYPESTVILGETTYKAQFTFLDEKWYELKNSELFNPKYSISAGTMTFDAYMNTNNIAVKVPDTISSNGVDCKVVGLGFYYNTTDIKYEHTDLEFVRLPSHLKEIFANGFKNCSSLAEIELPESVQRIGRSAFQGCNKLKTVHIPANVQNISDAAFADCLRLTRFSVDSANKNFIGNENYLVDTKNRKFLQGITGEIPADYTLSSLGQNCFSNTGIEAVNVPEGITTIGSNAFSRCSYLCEVTLPSTLTSIGATCFSWCGSLESITLPESLEELPTYAFNECALREITIPTAVGVVRDRAFGYMPSLQKVVFNVGLDGDGNIKIPQIHKQAFLSSGTAANHVKFYVPWSKTQHEQKFEGFDKEGNALDPFFGAVGVTYDDFVFNYVEEVE